MSASAEIAKLRRHRERLAISIPSATFFAALFTLVLFGISKLISLPTWLVLTPAITLALSTITQVISYFHWGRQIAKLEQELPKEN